MSPQWKRPPLPEETFSDRFGEGEGELLTLTYPKPLPMRLDRWLVSQRTEQSRARIQKFIDAGYVRVNGKTGKAKTPLRNAISSQGISSSLKSATSSDSSPAAKSLSSVAVKKRCS